MPHLDDIRCKHCNALVALIARASIVGRTTFECLNCGVRFVVWPVERTKVYTQERQEAVA